MFIEGGFTMKNRRKILSSIFLAMVMIVTFCIQAMATEIENETYIEVPIVTVNENLNVAEIGKILLDSAKTSTNDITTASTPTIIYATITRSGNTDTCHVYLTWSGTDLYYAWRFKSLTIEDTSFLFPKTYATFGDGKTYSTYYTGVSSVGTVFIGYATIPTHVNKVKVSVKDLQGYNLTSGGWLSALTFTGTVTIN